MAARPWITPQNVRDYTDIEAIKTRADEKLKIDIAMAERYIIDYTRNDFTDIKYASGIPGDVMNAELLLAEAFAKRAISGAKQADALIKTGLKSETFDEYSYSVSEGAASFDIESQILAALLDAYVLAPDKGSIRMRLRKL